MLLTISEQRVHQGKTPAAPPTKNHLCVVQHFPILQYKVSPYTYTIKQLEKTVTMVVPSMEY